MGKYTMSTYEFHQIENEKPLTSADFVPREQFDALNAKLDQLMEQLSKGQPTAEVAPVETETKQGRSKNG
ncbi:MAG: hypothetical protein ACI4T5_10440 [Prevotella sp.]